MKTTIWGMFWNFFQPHRGNLRDDPSSHFREISLEPFSKLRSEDQLYCPKNPDPSKVAILRTRTPSIQVQTLPLEGPRILRVKGFMRDDTFWNWNGLKWLTLLGTTTISGLPLSALLSRWFFLFPRCGMLLHLVPWRVEKQTGVSWSWCVFLEPISAASAFFSRLYKSALEKRPANSWNDWVAGFSGGGVPCPDTSIWSNYSDLTRPHPKR